MCLAPKHSQSLWELAFEIQSKIIRTRGQNSKLGATMSWSLPAVDTCPGRTLLCTKSCYARRLQARRANVLKSWHRSYELSLHPLFADALALALKGLPAGQLRIHVSGDFYSVAYLKAWIKALKGAPQLAPFAFTRSWRVPALRKALKEAGWPTWILASTDQEAADAPAEMREASMADVSVRAVKAGKEKAPALLCPEQSGAQDSCASCGRCPMARVTPTGLHRLPMTAKVGVSFAIH